VLMGRAQGSQRASEDALGCRLRRVCGACHLAAIVHGKIVAFWRSAQIRVTGELVALVRNPPPLRLRSGQALSAKSADKDGAPGLVVLTLLFPSRDNEQ
jgi:hypothetical protein